MSELEIKNDKILIGIPRERFSLNQFIDSRDKILYSLQTEDRIAGEVIQIESHRVDINRDRITKIFLEHTERPDWLLMLDSDMDHPIRCGQRLTSWRKPIVGGLYFHRGASRYHDPMAFMQSGYNEEDGEKITPLWRPIRKKVFDWLVKIRAPFVSGSFIVEPQNEESLVPVDGIGTGCILIHRSVLEKMNEQGEPIWEYRYRRGSEDLDFCYRAKKLGFQAYVDMSVVSGHYVIDAVGHPHFMNMYRNEPYKQTKYTIQDAGMWLEKYMGIEDGIGFLVDFEDKPVFNDVINELWHETIPEDPDPSSVAGFYKDKRVGDQYIGDLIHWNMSPQFDMIRSKLIPYSGNKILEIGSGIGTVSIQLCYQANIVDSVEINDVLREFAQKRYDGMSEDDEYSPERRGDIEFLSSIPYKRNYYDIVVAIDTFEHFHEDELKKVVASIADMLKSGGRLFCHNTWGNTIHHTHYNHSALFDKLVRENEFAKMDDLTYIKV